MCLIRRFIRLIWPECVHNASLLLQNPTGIPILKIVFPDSKMFGLISLPLLVYHPTQILLGSLLVPYLQTWVATNDPKNHEADTSINDV